jgi:general secretion pathway protein A
LEQSQADQKNLYLKWALGIFGIGLLSSMLYVTHSSHLIDKNQSAKSQISSVSSSASSSAASSAPSITLRNYHDAEDIFFTYLGAPLAPETRPCGRNLKASQQCAKVSLHTWTDVSELNRPLILIMSTPEKFSTYLIMIGLNAENALILNEQQEKIIIPLAKLGRDWTGEAVYLWKRPPAFSETLVLGDSSPTVAWVAQQFAKLDKQKDPLSDDLFSTALQERIKIFQRSKGITVDGNITEQTLLKMNEAVGADKTLLTEFNETNNHVPTP